MFSKGAICLSRLLFKMGLFTVYFPWWGGGGAVGCIQTFRRIRIRKNQSGFGYEMNLK
jgi:hypothetical protein